MKVISDIATLDASAYIRKLCKHFIHKIPARYTEVSGQADFPKGTLRMLATPTSLQAEIEVDSPEDLPGIQGAFERHLVQFAFRETLEINWKEVPDMPDWQEVARQLRNPQGAAGRQTGMQMNRSNQGMIQRAFALLELKPGDTVLEIGPGNGTHVPAIPGISAVTYTGADISETMLAEAIVHNKNLPNVSFLKTDGRVLPFGAASFDKIVTVNTLYFWEEPLAFATEIRKALKPGGRFCLAIATAEFMKTLPFTTYGFTLYSADAARSLLEKAGFSIKEIVTTQETIESNTGQPVTRDLVLVLASY